MMAMQQPDVALPDEDAVEVGDAVMGDEVRELALVVGEQDDRDFASFARISRARRSGVMSSMCSVVMIRSKRSPRSSSFSASAPLETRVSSGVCERWKPWYSLWICS